MSMDQQDNSNHNADANQPEASRPADSAAERSAFDQLREETSQPFPGDADGRGEPSTTRDEPARIGETSPPSLADTISAPGPRPDQNGTKVDLEAPTDYDRTINERDTPTQPQQRDEWSAITEISEYNIPTNQLDAPWPGDPTQQPTQKLENDVSRQTTEPLDNDTEWQTAPLPGGVTDYDTRPGPTEPLELDGLNNRVDRYQQLQRNGADSPLQQEHDEFYRQDSP